MIDTATLATFMAVVLGLFLVPGPAMLLLVTRTAQGGRAVGVATGAGIAAGDSCTRCWPRSGCRLC